MDISFIKPVQIETLKLKGNIFYAPMAGYSDHVTRGIMLDAGAFMAYTEMVSAEALCRGNAKTLSMLKRAPGEEILAVQLFGSSADVIGRAAGIAKKNGADLIDINAGCPVKKVISKGAGAALAAQPEKLYRAVKAAAESGLPVSVKIRKGLTAENENWKESAAAAEEAGAAALGFHPRSAEQMYRGKSDWNAIKMLSDILSIPVVGSGDLLTKNSVKEMFEKTGCSAVMIARGAVGNPDIFNFSGKNTTSDESVYKRNKVVMALEHLELYADEYGKEKTVHIIKKHLAGYIKGWEGSSALKKELLTQSSYSEIRNLLITEL